MTAATGATKARLRRLVSSGLCETEDAERHAAGLRRLAEALEDDARLQSEERLFRALGDATRLRIVRLLAVREMCVCEVMVALGLTQPTASHHLRILERQGIAARRREGKWMLYRLSSRAAVAVLTAAGRGAG